MSGSQIDSQQRVDGVSLLTNEKRKIERDLVTYSWLHCFLWDSIVALLVPLMALKHSTNGDELCVCLFT